jgi:hypothetical protein
MKPTMRAIVGPEDTIADGAVSMGTTGPSTGAGADGVPTGGVGSVVTGGVVLMGSYQLSVNSYQ